MGFVRVGKRLLRRVAAVWVNAVMPRLAPGFPRLTADDWLGCRPSFSQLGEDRLLSHLLEGVTNPGEQVYVDLGAHDPVIYSNTLLLHRRGWRGVNVDASEAAVRKFQAARPADRNLWAAVSDAAREVAYYQYPSAAANRIGAPDEADPRNVLGEQPVAVSRTVTRPLNDLLAEHLYAGEQIGLLNIDCEGEDLALLRHLDWSCWRPRVVCVESHDGRTTEEMTRLMAGVGYALAGQAAVSLLFQDERAGNRRASTQ